MPDVGCLLERHRSKLVSRCDMGTSLQVPLRISGPSPHHALAGASNQHDVRSCVAPIPKQETGVGCVKSDFSLGQWTRDSRGCPSFRRDDSRLLRARPSANALFPPNKLVALSTAEVRHEPEHLTLAGSGSKAPPVWSIITFAGDLRSFLELPGVRLMMPVATKVSGGLAKGV
jgi:hypothetical protein